MIRHILAGAVALVWAAPLAAHEFWIDPQAFEIAPDDPLVAHIRVGTELEGSVYAYVPPNFRRFEIVLGEQVIPVEGRAGDRPALNMAVPGGEGLAVVVHLTKDYKLTYREWDKFLNFCEHKDFEWAVARHAARGLPQTGFREIYSRHAKSLIAIGDGAGQDRAVGLETEIVAGANPYTDDLSNGMPVQVLYQGAPRADAQVELFEKDAEGTVKITLHRTDAQGRVTVPVRAGHMYLVDHVVMRERDPTEENDAVWESLWASLTFEVPK